MRPPGFWCCALSVLLAGCTGVLFQPERGHRLDPADHGIDYRDVRFRAGDGTPLHGWYLPADQPRGTVVFAHGNAQNISTHIANVWWLANVGYNVFLFDYRGYGRSAGVPTMIGVHRDTAAALDAADGLDDLPPQRRVLLGQSLGGAVATVTLARSAKTQRVGALVIDSAPSDYRAIAREKLAASWLTWPVQIPLSWLISDRFAAIEAAPALPEVPKLFIGNVDDATVPAHHVRAIYAASDPPKSLWLVEAPGHIATFATAKRRQRFVEWLDRALNEGKAIKTPNH